MIEPKLKSFFGVILYDYPPSQGVLSEIRGESSADSGVNKKCSSTLRAKRLEAYIYGVEVTNGCLEMRGQRQHQRHFAQVEKVRADLGYEIPGQDQGFLTASAHLPKDLGGVACGFDRLLALTLGESSLNAVIPFRYEKPYFSK